MGKSAREAQVGFAVIVAFVILVVGVLWFKQFRFAGGMATYNVDFPAVEGLQVRDRVQVRGIRMGAVDKIEIVEDFVRVVIQVERKALLRHDAIVELQTIGIVGEMVIDIDPGTGEPVQEGHTFKGQLAVSLPAMTGAATEALDDLRFLAQDIRDFLSDVRRGDRIGGTLDAAHSTVGQLDEFMRDNREDLRSLIKNFKEASAALREALAGPDSNLTLALDGAADTFSRADSVLTNLERTSACLVSVVERLEEGKGTAGRLLADDRLYARADSTLTAVNELLDDVQRNPRKYFKFSFIDF
jgi:phospholipid/cholesterol/gamma-HCH transport system substrate-binding protein